MVEVSPEVPSGYRPRRRLRVVFAADAANFGSLVAMDETGTLDALWETRRIAREELAATGGWLFGMAGDGIFALFESAADAVRCAMQTQYRLAQSARLKTLRLRIGLHLGEVLFHEEVPFGETLVIAARLESLADPGGILVSEAVMQAAAPRVNAIFADCGVRELKHCARPVATFSVMRQPIRVDLNRTGALIDPLDQTVRSVRLLSAVTSRLGGHRHAAAVLEHSSLMEAATGPQMTAALRNMVPDRRDITIPRPAVHPLPWTWLQPSADAIAKDGPGHGSGDGKAGGHGAASAPAATVGTGSTPAPAAAVKAPDPPAPKPTEADAIEACLPQLTAALMVHLGPFSRVLVKRHAAVASTRLALIEALALEITPASERIGFMQRVNHLISDIDRV